MQVIYLQSYSKKFMILKLALKVLVLALELFLAVYSFIITDSLLVKFLFFVFSAGIIAFAVTRIARKLLPPDKDYLAIDKEIAENET